MDINLIASFDIGTKALCKLVDDLKNPAIVLDDSLRIISKNSIATRMFPNLRKGRQVGGLMLAADKEKLRSLGVGQTVLVKLLCGEAVYGATALRLRGDILLFARPLSAGIRERLEEVYGRASGYDINILAENPDKNDFIEFSLKNLCFPKGNRAFNLAVVTEMIINHLRAGHPSVSEKITVNYALKNNYGLGSEYDFSIILIYIISFCRYCTEGNIHIELFEKDGILSARVSALPPENGDESRSLIDGIPKDVASWQGFLKMLCDGNLWDLEVKGGYKKPIVFTIKMPSAEGETPFVVSDGFKQVVARILSAFFG